METARQILWECAMRGYFTLKAVFVRLDLSLSKGLPPTFDVIFANYILKCKQVCISGQERAPATSRSLRLMGQAFCEVAGVATRNEMGR